MTVVSSKEFVSNQKKYFDLALSEGVVIKRGRNMFHLMYAPAEKQYPHPPNPERTVEEKYESLNWYGITDAEDNEEGFYSGEEVVRNAIEALVGHHENQVFKNRPKAD